MTIRWFLHVILSVSEESPGVMQTSPFQGGGLVCVEPLCGETSPCQLPWATMLPFCGSPKAWSLFPQIVVRLEAGFEFFDVQAQL